MPGRIAQLTLLSVTVLGTMCNNIINVPLRSIAADLRSTPSAAVLCVSAFVLMLAIALPISGWLGDRVGQKQTLVGALLLMLVTQALAAFAPNLAALVVLRGVQGLACSAIPPIVMGLLRMFYPERGLSVMGSWAAANGVGQAIGPATGGLISDAWGWRMIFVMLGAACLAVLVLTWLFVPAVAHRSGPFDVRGAMLLTGGVGLVLVAATTFSQRTGSPVSSIAEAAAGILLLFAYVVVSRRRSGAMIPLEVLAESRFLRSTGAAFGQMFCLGTVLVAFPLFFTGPLHMSNGLAGILLFTLPAVMAVAAPFVSRLSVAVGPRRVLRSGLAVLIAGSAVISVLVVLGSTSAVAVALTTMLLVLGVGMAMVQTPAAAGATSSPAGAYGAAVGLFNMVRFSGTAIAAAWVALVYPTGSMLLLFGGCVLLAALALAASYLGPTPGAGVNLPVSRTADPGLRAGRFHRGR